MMRETLPYDNKEEKAMKEYLSSIQDVLKEQNTSEEGLSSQEAASRLEKFGHNKLKERKIPFLRNFLMNWQIP